MLNKAKKREAETEAKVDITPLIDVVFLLLIFVMAISQLAAVELQANLSLPVAAQANPEQEGERDRLIINLDENGDIYVANFLLSRADLNRILAREARRTMGEDGFSTRPVYIRADADLPFGEVQDVMTMCREHKIWRLSLRVIRAEEGGAQ